MAVQVKCEGCGEGFWIKYDKFKNSKLKKFFCSRACQIDSENELAKERVRARKLKQMRWGLRHSWERQPTAKVEEMIESYERRLEILKELLMERKGHETTL